MSIIGVPAQIKKINRITEMTAIFVKHQIISAAEPLASLNPVALVSRLADHAERMPHRRSRGYLIRKIVEDLGTTYIKFGQWLSVRPEFVPPDIIEELERLQDR